VRKQAISAPLHTYLRVVEWSKDHLTIGQVRFMYSQRARWSQEWPTRGPQHRPNSCMNGPTQTDHCSSEMVFLGRADSVVIQDMRMGCRKTSE
jgi:hypothetical protein